MVLKQLNQRYCVFVCVCVGGVVKTKQKGTRTPVCVCVPFCLVLCGTYSVSRKDSEHRTSNSSGNS